MKKITLLLIILLIFCFTSACQNHKKDTDLSQNAIKNIEKNENKNNKNVISEKEDISDEFLEKKYPGKQILHWVYGEEWKLSQEDMDIFGEKYGTHHITNEQVMKLNDYLSSLGKNYVINYKRLGCGEEYIKEVKNLIDNGNSPDFITANPFCDSDAEIYRRIMKYDFISEGLLEELTPYLNNELKKYKNAVPENVFKLSRVNGKFYGFDTSIHSVAQKNIGMSIWNWLKNMILI